MPNYATLNYHTEDELAIVEVLARRIYLHVVEEFREELHDVLSNTTGGVLLNFGKVSVMNSAGLGVLISLQDQLQKQERKLVITSLQPLMQEIFGRMRLETLITVAKTPEEGLKILRGGGK
jgi:anti-anti-sigma factor